VDVFWATSTELQHKLGIQVVAMVFEDFWIVNFLRRICKLLFRNDLDGLAYLEGSGSHEDDLLASLQPRFDLYIVAGAKAEFDGPMLNLAIDYYVSVRL